MGCRPLVSFILATYNRADVVIETLARIADCGLEPREYEVLVVDNASTDRTADRIRRRWPDVHLLELDRNRGSCAKGLALPMARGEYIVFLDDDSYPLDQCVPRMVRHFQDQPTLGAAGFMVHLPDGRLESSALPNVFVGCGVGFRREVLNRVGGLDVSYFMQAEEYDLSFRLIRAGYDVRTFGDLSVRHLKSRFARSSKRTIFYDVRNNLTLAATYLPAPWHGEFMRDWSLRYGWLACESHADQEYRDGLALGLLRGWYTRLTRSKLRLDVRVMSTLFGIDLIASRTAELGAQGCSRLLFADLGKNIYPHYRAAVRAGLEVVAVMDDRFAGGDRLYRGVPIVTCKQGLALRADAVVVSNSSPVHAGLTESKLRSLTTLPVHRWHGRFDWELREPIFVRPSCEFAV